MSNLSISDNIQRVQEQIASACAKAKRQENEITLIAVSKTHPADTIIEAIQAGLSNFGENRVGESQTKVPKINNMVDTKPTWHYIGHIQSRQAKDVVPLFDVVHSIDRLKIARKLSALAQDANKTIEAMIEINISGENAKYGFDASNWKTDNSVKAQLWQDLKTIISLPNLKIRGLMTMAPFYDNMEATRPVFVGLAELRDSIQDDFGLSLND